MKNRNQMVSDAIRKMVLPEDVEAVINDTDINCIADLFGGMNAEEIVRFVRSELVDTVTKNFDGYGEKEYMVQMVTERSESLGKMTFGRFPNRGSLMKPCKTESEAKELMNRMRDRWSEYIAKSEALGINLAKETLPIGWKVVFREVGEWEEVRE